MAMLRSKLMAESLGRLLGAPLVYVLAEVRLSPILDTAKRAAAAQEVLRSKFPRLTRLNEVQTVLGPSATLTSAQSYSFSDRERSKGVVVTGSSVVYHVTSYKESRDFFEELGWVLTTLETLYAGDLVARLGLRYVDAIVPMSGESASAYIRPEFAGIDLESGHERKVQMLAEYPRNNGALTLRYLCLGPGVYLTPDLVPDLLAEPEWVRRARKSGQSAALLDTDRWENFEQSFLAANLLNKFKDLKADIRRAFLSSTTPYAREVWEKPRVLEPESAIANG